MNARTAAALVVLAVSISATARGEPHVVQSLRLTEQPNGLVVSPSGTRLALLRFNGVSLHEIEADGRVGRCVSTVDMLQPTEAVFTPNGRHLVCADCTDDLKVIDRSTMEVTTVELPPNMQPVAMVAAIDPKRIYVVDSSAWVVTVDPAAWRVVDSFNLYMGPGWRGVDLCLRPDEEMLYVCYRLFVPEIAQGCVYGFPVGAGKPAHEPVAHMSVGGPSACTIGPTPDHLVITDQLGFTLTVMDMDDGEEACWLNLDLDFAVDVASSADFEWVVVPDMSRCSLTAVTGDCLRFRIEHPDEIYRNPYRFEVPLNGRPAGVVCHPTLQVAYVWSWENSRIDVVSLGMPPD